LVVGYWLPYAAPRRQFGQLTGEQRSVVSQRQNGVADRVHPYGAPRGVSALGFRFDVFL